MGAGDGKGTVVTGALGARYRFTDSLSIGGAYEIPLTSRKDLIDSRITFDLVWSF